MKYIRKRIHSAWGRFLIIGFLLSTAGCLQNITSYKGKTVAEENRIALEAGGPHKGVWNTEDLTLNYEYTQKSNEIELSGAIAFGNSVAANYTTMERFFLQVHFTDREGKILEDKVIASSGNRKFMDNVKILSFTSRLVLPRESAGMVFSYSGRATEGGGLYPLVTSGGDGADWDFWKTPLR